MQLSDLKNLKRFKDIITVLATYGFAEIIDRFDEIPGAEWLRRISPVDEELDVYQRIRRVFEALGPTFVKFGQIMSLRPDLLPEPLLKELEKLQDNVPGVPTETIMPLIEEAIGGPFQAVFSVFPEEPFAAASLSQVYRAVLRQGGEVVAVKVQRPGIVDDIRADLDILEAICRLAHDNLSELQVYDLPNLVRTVRRHIVKELDFGEELESMTIARSVADKTGFFVPAPYEQYSSDRVLVMEYFAGTTFREIDTVPGLDYEALARRGLRGAVTQILELGFFHADPHPGNLLVGEDGTLCLIDWGMVGRLTDRDRYMLIDLLQAVVDKDSESLAEALLVLCHSREKLVEAAALERDLLAILDRYYAVPIKDVNLGHLLARLLTLLRSYRLQLPNYLVIMIKALITAEGSVRLIYPDLDVVSAVRGQVHRLARRRYHPRNWWRELRTLLVAFRSGPREIPRRLQRIITKLEQGELGFVFHLEKLEDLVGVLESASNRLTAGIVAGAIIIGSSMIITTGIGPLLFGLPALGVIGYLLSVVLGLYLVVTILKTRKY